MGFECLGQEYPHPSLSGNQIFEGSTLALLPSGEHIDRIAPEQHGDIMPHLILPFRVGWQPVVHRIDRNKSEFADFGLRFTEFRLRQLGGTSRYTATDV